MKIFKMMRGMQNRITRDKIIVATRLALFHNLPTKSYDFTTFPIPADVTFTRTTTATYWDTNGVMQTAAIGEPRPYRLPTGGAILGLMIEESATNKVLQSDDFSNAAWSKQSGATVIAPITAPDPTELAYKLVSPNGSIGYLTNSPNISVVAGQIESYSIMAKYDAVFPQIMLLAQSGMFTDAISRVATFNIQTGVLGAITGDGATSTIEPAADGWYICTLTFTPDVTIASGVQIRSTANGDGVNGVYIWGVDYVRKAARTSHIKTTTVAVTRASDNSKVSTIPWFNAPEGSFQVTGGFDGLGSNDVRVPVNMNSGTSSNSITGFNALGDFRCEAVAANVVELNPLAPLVNLSKGSFKQAFNYKLNYMNQAVNGTLSDPDTTGVLPTGINQMIIGAAISTYYINGYIANINYWNTKLTDEQLLDLSSESLRSF